MLNTGEWGDITVKYGDITRTLHSAIVCSQSPFFADAVTKAVTVIPNSTGLCDIDTDMMFPTRKHSQTP